MATHIIIADDHPLFRDAIAKLLMRLDENINVSQADDFSALKELLDSPGFLPSLVMLDLKLPDVHGLEGLLQLKKRFPALPIVIVSAYDDTTVIHNAMQHGASGFLPKSLDTHDMGNAISQILQGDLWFPSIDENQPTPSLALKDLTTTQLKVLTLLKEGMPSKSMADLLGCKEATIKAHLTVIFRKLNVTNRTQAVLIARQLDLPNSGIDF